MLINFQLIFLLLALMGNPAPSPRTDDPVDKTCSFKGKKLYGKIKFVDNFPDIKIKIVENFPDLKVHINKFRKKDYLHYKLFYKNHTSYIHLI